MDLLGALSGTTQGTQALPRAVQPPHSPCFCLLQVVSDMSIPFTWATPPLPQCRHSFLRKPSLISSLAELPFCEFPWHPERTLTASVALTTLLFIFISCPCTPFGEVVHTVINLESLSHPALHAGFTDLQCHFHVHLLRFALCRAVLCPTPTQQSLAE